MASNPEHIIFIGEDTEKLKKHHKYISQEVYGLQLICDNYRRSICMVLPDYYELHFEKIEDFREKIIKSIIE